jgi:hypothetical protein
VVGITTLNGWRPFIPTSSLWISTTTTFDIVSEVELVRV